jgi:hypothetical protein
MEHPSRTPTRDSRGLGEENRRNRMKDKCPKCGRLSMVDSGDGDFIHCEFCHTQVGIDKQQSTNDEIRHEARFNMQKDAIASFSSKAEQDAYYSGYSNGYHSAMVTMAEEYKKALDNIHKELDCCGNCRDLESENCGCCLIQYPDNPNCINNWKQKNS